MIKKHVLFVVSDEPINAGDIEKQKGVAHFIHEELSIEGNGCGEMIVEKKIPTQTMKEAGNVYIGKGRSVSVAIADFLHSVCDSVWYEPLRIRREREIEKQRKEKVILDAFDRLDAEMPDCAKSNFEFRFPEINEKVIVQHGYLKGRIGAGTVKSVIDDSGGKKVMITIHDKIAFDIVYTCNTGSSRWECMDGASSIGGASSIVVYPKDEGIPLSFTFILPPTDAARNMADNIYLERLRRSFPSGQASSL